MSTVKPIFLTAVIFTAHLWSTPLLADNPSYSVKLQSIEKIRSAEKDGDELFISVTEFPEEGVPKNYQIPSFPTHWLSAHLKNVKDVTLWQKDMQTCKGVKVVFSLVEEDVPPWNLNDLLGSVVLDLKCENGKAVPNWTIPNKENTEKLTEGPSKFLFKGYNSEYHADFHLENKH
jgi:hypothetical protein